MEAVDAVKLDPRTPGDSFPPSNLMHTSLLLPRSSKVAEEVELQRTSIDSSSSSSTMVSNETVEEECSIFRSARSLERCSFSWDNVGCKMVWWRSVRSRWAAVNLLADVVLSMSFDILGWSCGSFCSGLESTLQWGSWMIETELVPVLDASIMVNSSSQFTVADKVELWGWGDGGIVKKWPKHEQSGAEDESLVIEVVSFGQLS